jgi:hypothetical protein
MLFTCTDFRGHWPVGVAAVIRADTADEAEHKLRAYLTTIGLPQEGETLTLVQLAPDDVIILNDGNY